MFSERARQRLEDIVENADWIASDLDGVSRQHFVADRMRADAVERCLGRLTEAVIQLGEEAVRDAHLNVPWHEIRNLGNRLRHEYRRIDRQLIYSIAIDEVPALRAAAAKALEY